ncbi:MAG TPA: enoyl-CoA hydratase-related protein [Candidatus Lokiarchaeia archaeon]|nr:enoyl-CoA hydratase-related protein [Candidatus Lokiarchaeia archaeon]
MSFETVLLEKENNIAILTLNRPERKNAINATMFEELKKALDLAREDPEIRALIITGAGNVFSSGGDFTIDYSQADNEDSQAAAADVSQKQLVLKLITTYKPIIAAVNGLALGAAFNLALNCDLVYAAESSEMGTFFIKRAITPEMSSTYLLPRLVGIHKAKELIFFGDKIPAREAKAIGLINDVFPDEEFMDKVKELAGRLAHGPTIAIGLAKKAIHDLLTDKITQALDAEAENMWKVFDTKDFLEGVLSFVEKRDPDYRGE